MLIRGQDTDWKANNSLVMKGESSRLNRIICAFFKGYSCECCSFFPLMIARIINPCILIPYESPSGNLVDQFLGNFGLSKGQSSRTVLERNVFYRLPCQQKIGYLLRKYPGFVNAEVKIFYRRIRQP